jgi:putative ABC transport system permease protein
LEGEDTRLAGRLLHSRGILPDHGLVEWIVANEPLLCGRFKCEYSLAGRRSCADVVVLRKLVAKFHQVLPLAFRHGFANLYRPGNQARSVLVALGIGVMFTLATYLLQRTVLREVNGEGPGRQGNLFLAGYSRLFPGWSAAKESAGSAEGSWQLVGYVVSRMLEKNGVPAANLALSNNRKDQLQTVRLTSADALPDGLKVLEGPLVECGRC